MSRTVDDVIESLNSVFFQNNVVPFFSKDSHPSNEEFKVYLFNTVDAEKARKYGFLSLLEKVQSDEKSMYIGDFLNTAKDLQHFGLGGIEKVESGSDGDIIENHIIRDPMDGYEEYDQGGGLIIYIPKIPGTTPLKKETKKTETKDTNYYSVLENYEV